ncbi:MAG: hypothetical protein LBS83_02610 [Holosporales bacterium]|nr:hypothetical protein [Holosporales bacterium]
MDILGRLFVFGGAIFGSVVNCNATSIVGSTGFDQDGIPHADSCEPVKNVQMESLDPFDILGFDEEFSLADSDEEDCLKSAPHIPHIVMVGDKTLAEFLQESHERLLTERVNNFENAKQTFISAVQELYENFYGRSFEEIGDSLLKEKIENIDSMWSKCCHCVIDLSNIQRKTLREMEREYICFKDSYYLLERIKRSIIPTEENINFRKILRSLVQRMNGEVNAEECRKWDALCEANLREYKEKYGTD